MQELHNGRVGVYSGGPGKGSAFRLYLPLSKAPRLRKDGKADPPKIKSIPHLLLIEDMQDVAELIRLLLVEEGHHVVVAEDGIKGLTATK